MCTVPSWLSFYRTVNGRGVSFSPRIFRAQASSPGFSLGLPSNRSPGRLTYRVRRASVISSPSARATGIRLRGRTRLNRHRSLGWCRLFSDKRRTSNSTQCSILDIGEGDAGIKCRFNAPARSSAHVVPRLSCLASRLGLASWYWSKEWEQSPGRGGASQKRYVSPQP